MPEKDRQQPTSTLPDSTAQVAERLVTVETQQEHDLLTGERFERVFVKLYMAARTSGLLATIPDRDWKTLCVLATYMNRDGYCYPSQDELAKALGCTRQTANERIQSLAQFRFQGKPVMLMPDQERAGQGRFSGKRYQVLPIARMGIFDQPQQPPRLEKGTVSANPDTVKTPTVSASTVSANPDTNKNKESLEQEQQQDTTPARPVADPASQGSAVVVSGLREKGDAAARATEDPIRTAPRDAQGASAPADELAAFGLADLTNELTRRGVAAAAVRKWLKARSPDYIRQLLDYHDWCQAHRQGFIQNSGGWLAASLANPIPFPENYLQRKESEARRSQVQARKSEQERMGLWNEARRHATPAEERARSAQAGWLRSYQIVHRGQTPSPEEQEAWYRRQVASLKEEAEAFFAEHPSLEETGERQVGEEGAMAVETLPQDGLSTTSHEAKTEANSPRRRLGQPQRVDALLARSGGSGTNSQVEQVGEHADEHEEAVGRSVRNRPAEPVDAARTGASSRAGAREHPAQNRPVLPGVLDVQAAVPDEAQVPIGGGKIAG